MTHIKRFDHVGITVADLDPAIAFVGDLQAAVDAVAANGYGLVAGIGEYQGQVRMAYVRGPEGIIVSLFEYFG